MTPFSTLLAGMQQEIESHGHSIILPPDWLQCRTAYGGLSAALCLEATHRGIENLPPLRSAQYCFVGGTRNRKPEYLCPNIAQRQINHACGMRYDGRQWIGSQIDTVFWGE